MAMYAIDREGAPLPLWRILLMPGGRVSRAPMNLTVLGNLAVFILVGAIGSYYSDGEMPSDVIALPLGLVLVFGQYISLAMGAKRLHDLGRTGWWQLLYLLPLANIVLLVFLMASPSRREDNIYGPYPLADKVEVAAAEAARPGTAEKTPEEEPITYPLPFLKVLFSFRGRLNRRAFWLKGVLPTVIIVSILHGLIGGIVMFMIGASVVGGIVDPLGFRKAPVFLPTSQFQSTHGRTVGVVTADAEGTRLEIELAAPRDTARMAREVVLSGRRLSVTAAKKPDKAIGYDLTFAWRNPPPAPVQAPASMRLATQVVAGLGAVLSLLLMWPWFAIAVKRFHDRDQSGWWSLLGLVPLIGQIWLLVVLGFFKGTDGDNRFGPDPLAAAA